VSQVDLAAIARQIDPGPVPLLSPLLPAALRKDLQAGPIASLTNRQEQLTRIASQRNDFTKAASLKGNVNLDDAITRSALEAMLVLEPLAMDDSAKADAGRAAMELVFMYSIVEGAASYAQHMPEVLRAQIEAGVARLGLAPLYAAAVKDVPRLSAMMAARALRLGDNLAIADALKTAAGELGKSVPFERVLALHEESIARRGANVMATDFIPLAAVCLNHLQLECGRKYLDQVRKRRNVVDPRFGDMTQAVVDAQLQGLVEQADLVQTLSATQAKADLESRALHGRTLVLLGKYDQAEAELTKLALDAPEDARPVALQARLIVARDGASDASVRRAAGLLLDAQKRTKGKDSEFYDADVGFRGQVMVWDLVTKLSSTAENDRASVLTAEIVKMRGLVQEMSAFQPDRAEVVELLIKLLSDIMAGGADVDMRAQIAAYALAAEVLRKKYPASIEAAAAARAFGVLVQNRDGALAALEFPWPKGREYDQLQTNLLAQRVALAVKWSAPDHLPQPQDLLAVAEHSQADAAFLRVLAADAAAVTAYQTGDSVAWAQAAAQYAGALETAPASERIRTAVNLAAANAASGHEDVAKQFLARAMASQADYAADENWPFVPLQLAALRVGSVPREESELAFAEILTGPHKSKLARERARRWLIWLAVQRKDLTTAKTLAKEAVDKAGTRDDSHYLGKTPMLVPDVISGSTFNMHFTPTKPSLYHLDLLVNALLIFVKEPALTGDEIFALAGKPRPKTPKKADGKAPKGKTR
jgi:hypothetical protein